MLYFSCSPKKSRQKKGACLRGAPRCRQAPQTPGRLGPWRLNLTGNDWRRERNELLPPPDAHCGTRPHAANFHSPPHSPPHLTRSHRGPLPLGRRNAEAAREPKRHGRDDIQPESLVNMRESRAFQLLHQNKVFQLKLDH